jgi:RHS repeat-associated protein
VARHDYTPFGEEIPGGYAGRGTEWGGYDAVNQKFTAKERDAETGLDYFGARYMSSAQGRFTSPDGPLLDQSSNEPQSWNIYAYGRNNPLRFTDPTGTTTCDANGNNCHDSITVTDKASGLSTIDAFLYRFLFAVVQPTLQIGQQGFDWLGKPRNGTCLASSTSAGASAGAGVGMLGLVGGPAVGISEPTAMAMGGGLGWVGGMISCMSSSGTGGGSREPEESANSGKDVERKIKQFTKKSLSEQKSIYKNLKNTYVKHLQKYGQTAGNTSGETNRMERELEQMKTILQSRGQSVD